MLTVVIRGLQFMSYVFWRICLKTKKEALTIFKAFMRMKPRLTFIYKIPTFVEDGVLDPVRGETNVLPLKSQRSEADFFHECNGSIHGIFAGPRSWDHLHRRNVVRRIEL